MPTKLFYSLFIIIASVTVFIKITEFFCSKKYPKQAGFKNLKEILHYSKQALEIIQKFKWIFFVPILITLLDKIVLLATAHEFILPNKAMMGFMNTSLENFTANIDLTRRFFGGMGLLSEGFYGVFNSNAIITIYMLLIISYPFILKYINRYLNNKESIQSRIFKKVFIMNVVALVLNYALPMISYVTGIENNFIINRIVIIISSFSSSFIVISNFSFFGLLFLQYVRNSIAGMKSSKRELVETSIDLYPLFLSLSLLIYFVIPLIFAISKQVIGYSPELRFTHNILRYCEIFIRFIFIPALFLAVLNRKTLSDTLEDSLVFITSRFKKFWQFTLVGIMGGFVLGICLEILQHYLKIKFGGSLHVLYNSLLYIAYAVPFMVAFFLFIKDEIGKE